MVAARHAAAVLTLTAAATLTACGSDNSNPPAPASAPTSSRAPQPHLVRGTLTIGLPNFAWNPGEGCWGRETLADVTAGTRVIVTDNTGATVGIGALDAGSVMMNPDDAERAQSCQFTFKVADVPAGKGFYGVEISGVPGRVQVPESDLDDLVQVTD
ncbi:MULTISPECIES: hypothetical protein [unclassified Micromonospora]|uniref:hypothetical protein n=1 Tax=unclassified Micromonospora TaxID=2617518 RepID=UPI00332726AF